MPRKRVPKEPKPGHVFGRARVGLRERIVRFLFGGKAEPAIFDVRSLDISKTLKPWPFDEVGGLAFDASESHLAVGADRAEYKPGGASSMAVWDVSEGKLLWEKPSGDLPLAFSRDGSRIFARSRFQEINDWTVLNARTGEQISAMKSVGPRGLNEGRLWTNPSGTQFVTAGLWTNPSGTQLVTIPASGQLAFWNVDQGKVTSTITMQEADDVEDRADAARLTPSAPVLQLLEIARRRLRACGPQ